MESRVREGEWSASERNPNQWTLVKRRGKTGNRAIATRTCFVDFLPPEINYQTLAFCFQKFGDIARIFIPEKLRSNCMHRYAFVSFFSHTAFNNAIKEMNGKVIGTLKLRVFPAKYDKPLPKSNPKTRQPNQILKTISRKVHRGQTKSYERDHRSYIEVSTQTQPPPRKNQTATFNSSDPRSPKKSPQTSSQKPKTHSNDQKFQKLPPMEPEPQPSCFHFEPDLVRRMSSRVLGEDTEKIRDDLLISKIDGEEFISLKGTKNDEMEEFYSRSVIATANSSQSSQSILDHILMEGINCLSIKPLGGMLHLITFSTMEDKAAMIESEWLLQWFLDLREVNDRSASLWRKTQLKILGVPLRGWGYNNFYNIGNVFGRVMAVDYSRFEYGTVTVITDCLFSINCKMALQIEDSFHKISIFEEHLCHIDDWISKVQPNHEKEKSEEDGACDTPPLTPVNSMAHHIHHNSQENSNSKPLDYLNDNEPIINSSPLPNTIIGKSPPPITSSPVTSKKVLIFSPLKSPMDNGPDQSKEGEKILTSAPTHTNSHIKLIESPNSLSPPKISKALSPITTSNSFNPLLKSNKPSTTSSLSSGPLFPPGFEDNIPMAVKLSHANKRAKKAKKKAQLRARTSSLGLPPLPSCTQLQPLSLSSSDIIQLANQLGLHYDGPMSSLQKRIDDILSRQQSDWRNIQ